MSRYRLLLLILFSVSSNADTFNIEEAWRAVQERNEGLKAADQGVVHARKMRDGAASMTYMPRVDLHGSYTHLSKPIDLDLSEPLNNIGGSLPIPLPPISSDDATVDLSEQDVFLANLSILWPIYMGGKTLHLKDIREAQIDESKAKLELKRQKSFILLVKYYYGALMSETYYKMRQDVEHAFEMHWYHAKKFKEQGQIAEVELLNAQVQYDKSTSETLKAKHKYEIAVSALKKMLKEESDISLSSQLFINDDLKTEEYYVERAKSGYAALDLLDAKRRQSESFVEIEKGSYMPTLSAFGNYTLYKDDSIISKSMPDWFAGVAVNINLLSATGRSEKYEAARVVNQQVSLLRAQAVQDISILAEKTYKEVQLYLEQYKTLDSSLRLAKENVRLREKSFSEGLSTSLEMVDAELFLAAIKTERLNVAYMYIQKLSQLLVLSGESSLFITMAQQGRKVENE